MRVGLEINARNDAFGDGDSFAAYGVADDGDLGLEGGDFAKGEDREVCKVREVFEGEKCEVTIVGDEFDFGGVFFWRAVDGDEDALLVGDDVCVGENLVFTDDEAGADAATEAA